MLFRFTSLPLCVAFVIALALTVSALAETEFGSNEIFRNFDEFEPGVNAPANWDGSWGINEHGVGGLFAQDTITLKTDTSTNLDTFQTVLTMYYTWEQVNDPEQTPSPHWNAGIYNKGFWMDLTLTLQIDENHYELVNVPTWIQWHELGTDQFRQIINFDISEWGIVITEDTDIVWSLSYATHSSGIVDSECHVGTGVFDLCDHVNIGLVYSQDNDDEYIAGHAEWYHHDSGTYDSIEGYYSQKQSSLAAAFLSNDLLRAEMTTEDVNAYLNNFDNRVLRIKPSNIDLETVTEFDGDGRPVWTVTAAQDENAQLIQGYAKGLELKDVIAKFETGAVIIVTDTTKPVSITGSEVILSWSGVEKKPFNPEEILSALRESLSESEFSEFIDKFADFDDPETELWKYLEKIHDKNYIFSNYGGFFGVGGEDMLDFSVLDVVTMDSTIVFDIQSEAGGTWYLDHHKIHIGAGEQGTTLNIVNDHDTVVARQIDDIIEGESVGGNLTKTGKGTLMISGVESDENNVWNDGLHISGTLSIEEGMLVMAGNQEQEGSAATTHHAGNVVIGGGATLDIQTRVTVELTGTDDSDVVIGAGGTLRIAGSHHSGIYNTEKTRTAILVNGGMIELYEGDLETVKAFSMNDEGEVDFAVDTILGSEGGTISIAAGLVYESGTVTGFGEYIEDESEESGGYIQYGDYRKTGGGTHVINGLDIGGGGLIIAEGMTVLNDVGETQQAGYVVIGGGESPTTLAVLDLKGGVGLQLMGGETYDIAVLSGGILRISSAEHTGIQKVELVVSEETEEEEEAGEPGGTGGGMEIRPSLDSTILFVNGGTMNIHKDDTDSTLLDLSTMNTVVGSNGGTVIVDPDVTFIGGSITSKVSGTLTKTGAGKHIVGNVNLGKGVYNVQQGTVEFTGDVKTGTLRGGLDTTIDMTQAQPAVEGFSFANFEIYGTYIGGGFDMIVGNGKVMGEEAQMTGVGHLTTKSGTFMLEAGEHRVQTLTIDGGHFNLITGAVLQMTNADDSPDIVIQGGGQLNIDAVSGAHFTKEGDSMSLLMLGGSVNFVNLSAVPDFPIVVDFSNINITLGEYEQRFNVAKDITLVSGAITGTALAEGEGPGHYTKQGQGTHEINGIFINGTISVGQGTVILNNVGTEQTAASVAVKKGGTLDIQSGADLTLTSMMSIEEGGVLTNSGVITAKTLYIDGGGTLQIHAIPNTAVTAVNTETLILEKGAKIDVSMEQLQLGTYSFENLLMVTGTGGVTNAHLAALNSHQTALRRYEWRTTRDRDSLNLTIELLTVQEYTGEIGWTQGNVSTIAGLIDQHIGDRYLTDGESENAMEMRGRSALNVLRAASGTVNSNREKLENLTGQALNSELRSAMAGELVGNAARMVMSSPHRTIFRHLETKPPVSRPTGWLGQAKSSHSKMQLWFTPYAQSEKGEADSSTFDGYTLTRAGLMIGGNMNITRQIVGGLVFQYGNPNIKNDLGKITADDFMIGAYMKIPVYGQITANAMIAYGMQQYTYQGPSNKAAFDGNMIFGSVELTRPYAVMSKLTLTPIVGVDFQSLKMDDLALTLPTLGRMAIDPDGLDTAAVRIGLQGEYLMVRTRAQYIRQVSGKDYMMSTIGLGSDTASLRSVQWGKDWVNVGLGCDLGQLNKIRFSADYDCDISKNTTSHIGTVKAVVTW